MEIGDWITIAAVVVALGLGVISIIHTRNVQKRELKIRLLKEIIEWVEDIEKPSLEVGIPVTDTPLPNFEIKRREANVILKYGIPFMKIDYIRSIAAKLFDKELS